MSDEALEAPNSPPDLYLASSPEEVEQARPFITGDVFDGITIPGLSAKSEGLGIVLTHPCSMRADGVRLIPRLHVASVAASQQIPLRKWSDGHFKVMPLPELNGQDWVVSFEQMGVVDSGSLLHDKRIACLSPYGIHLLQQRFIW